MGTREMNSSTKSIAELAYRLWDARGSRGSAEQDRIEAERLAAHLSADLPSDSDKVEDSIGARATPLLELAAF